MNKPIFLEINYVLELSPKAPFNFDATMYKPDHFPSTDNGWQPGIRWQTMLWDGKLLGLKFERDGIIGAPKIRLQVWSEERLTKDFIFTLTQEINYRYNIQRDLAEFNQLFKRDPHLGPIIEKWRGMRPMNYSSLYEYLIITIVLQNATVRRSVSMLQSLFEKYGTLLSYDSKQLYCFWQPRLLNNVSEDRLRVLKVGYRAKYMKKVTESFIKGKIDEIELRSKMREKQREALLKLYGIGPASVGYLLFDVFHHWDELRYIPPWEQKIYSKLFFNQEPDEPVPADKLLEFFDRRFGKYKALAVHYIWEDLFWKRKHEEIPWLEKLIRL